MHKCMVRVAKTTGNVFVFLVLLIIGVMYYQYMFLIWGPHVFGIPSLLTHGLLKKALWLPLWSYSSTSSF